MNPYVCFECGGGTKICRVDHNECDDCRGCNCKQLDCKRCGRCTQWGRHKFCAGGINCYSRQVIIMPLEDGKGEFAPGVFDGTYATSDAYPDAKFTDNPFVK